MRRAGFLPFVFFWALQAQSPPRQAIRVGSMQIANLNDLSLITRNPRDISAGSGVGPQTPVVIFETWAEQLSRQYAESVTAAIDPVEREDGRVIVHRMVRDAMHDMFFAYDVVVEPLARDESYRLTVKDSTLAAAPRVSGRDLQRVSPSFFTPQVVQPGDTFALTLYENGAGARRLVDYLHVGAFQEVRLRQGAAREFYAADGQFQIAAPKLRVNGEPKELAAGAVRLEGTTLALYVPQRGRFVLSLHPEEGFEKRGELNRTSLTILGGQDLLRLDCADDIVQGSGSYDVYVQAQPEWRPPAGQPLDKYELSAASAATRF